MAWSRADVLERVREARQRARAELRRGIGPGERILADGWSVLLTSRRLRVSSSLFTPSPPLEVATEAMTSWHVSWSHDGRPTVVVDHAPIERHEVSQPRTILWFHLGGKPVKVDRTQTTVPLPGRRDLAYRSLIAGLAELGLPREPDERRSIPGTREERIGDPAWHILSPAPHRRPFLGLRRATRPSSCPSGSSWRRSHPARR